LGQRVCRAVLVVTINLVLTLALIEIMFRARASIAYFAATLQDLTETVTRLMGSSQGLIYIHHPHLENLRAGRESFNNIVSDTIREVAARNDVRYYDATDDLKVEFGAAPERYYIANDMHFNESGLKPWPSTWPRQFPAIDI
jgi:hypothetical protein